MRKLSWLCDKVSIVQPVFRRSGQFAFPLSKWQMETNRYWFYFVLFILLFHFFFFLGVLRKLPTCLPQVALQNHKSNLYLFGIQGLHSDQKLFDSFNQDFTSLSRHVKTGQHNSFTIGQDPAGREKSKAGFVYPGDQLCGTFEGESIDDGRGERVSRGQFSLLFFFLL